MIENATGAILAGGAGKRLGGVQKAFLRKGRKTLIERQLALFEKLFPETLIVANDRKPYVDLGVRVVSDAIKDRGAPGGLHAALRSAKTEWVFLVACDMPALDRRVIEDIAPRAIGVEASVVRFGNRPEPLHAFWSVDLKKRLERMLRDGEPSFKDLLATIRYRATDIELLEARIRGASESFANVNTPEDLKRFGLKLPAQRPLR